MTKLKMAMAAGVAAVLAFGVAACGNTTQTTEGTEPAAAEATATPAEAPPVEAVQPADEAAAPPAEEAATTTTTTTTPSE